MGLIRSFSAADIAALKEQFHGAQPFPHLVIDDFIDTAAAKAFGAFPSSSWEHWNQFKDNYQKHKHTCENIQVIPQPYRSLIAECSEPPFLQVMQQITGLGPLIPDPYLDGGGLHSSGGGGVLAPHTDFHFYKRLKLYRQINLLIYFNPGWADDDGGRLGLFRKGEKNPTVEVSPVFGRAVIFKTDDQSVHGFTAPVRDGKWRNSVALYYYAACESAGFAGDTTTHWQEHGKMTGPRLALFESLIFASRAFSKMAHLINPNRKGDAA
jgi:hypothetical protein